MPSTDTTHVESFLGRFGVDPERGFLPNPDPRVCLPAAYRTWEKVVAELPKLLVAGTARRRIAELPALRISESLDQPSAERAMLILSYLAHAYVFGEAQVQSSIPAAVARPLHEVALRLGRPPVLSYASHALSNWRRLDPSGPIRLGNLARLVNFLGGQDEDWFVLVHVEIESKAAPALLAIVIAQEAVASNDSETLTDALQTIASTLRGMASTLRRMPEKCDPYVYYNRVRPFIFGWKDNPALPDGVTYEGVADYAGRPQVYRGETGAQSSIIPAVDAALGIDFSRSTFGEELLALREYMPPRHRRFIDAVHAGPSIRGAVLRPDRPRSLAAAYDDALGALRDFRTLHLEYAALYIHRQSQRSPGNPTGVGTGGTPFMTYLKEHRDALDAYCVSGND